jgi:hypothetical protein
VSGPARASERDPAARRRAARAGLAVVVGYAVLAALSGNLSPMARGPILDGPLPLPYRWVNPPPELASTNTKPAEGIFTLQMGPGGVLGQVVLTPDDQATVVVDDGAIAPHGGDRQVRVQISPLDPATLSPPGDGLVTFGNVYRTAATYEPSGAKVTSILKPMDVILSYPATVNLRSASHSIYASRDGKAWTKLKSTDNHTMQQAEAKVSGLGYVQVAGIPAAVPNTAVPGTGGGSHTTKTILLVAAICLLLVGAALVLRSRR